MKRARAFEALCKKEGIKRRPLVLKNVNSNISPQMMKWRRISSITLKLEPFMDDLERKACLGRLMGWLEKAFLHRRDAETQRTANSKLQNPNSKENDKQQTAIEETNGEQQLAGETPAGREQTNGDRNVPATRGAMDVATGQVVNQRLVHADWNSNISAWERVKRDGFSVEAVCAGLGISRWKLTQLTKEFCNLTATEVFDGFKLKQLKNFLIGRLRYGAQQLWGAPGEYAAYKANGFINCEGERAGSDSTLRDNLSPGPSPRRRGEKRSKFFRMTPQELFKEEKHEERERRVGELVERMWRGLDFESWVISAGFSSAARLKRAILNVLGKSLKELEKLLAAEVVDYYLCCEDRELCKLALQDDANHLIYRARELYHGKEEKPTAPFLDLWSATVAGCKEWLEKMAGEFG